MAGEDLLRLGHIDLDQPVHRRHPPAGAQRNGDEPATGGKRAGLHPARASGVHHPTLASGVPGHERRSPPAQGPNVPGPAGSAKTFFAYERNVVTETATAITARASRPPQRSAIPGQSGLADRAERPIWTSQLSGFHAAMACIQPGMKSGFMNAEDRNISGSMNNV